MSCQICQQQPCSCITALKQIIDQLKTNESIALSLHPKKGKDSWITIHPTTLFARWVYVLLGGRNNVVYSTLITFATTHLLFHYLLPRCHGMQLPKWEKLMPTQYDILSTIFWSGLSILVANDKYQKQQTLLMADDKFVTKTRNSALRRIQVLLKHCPLNYQQKEQAQRLIKYIEEGHCFSEGLQDQLVTVKFGKPKLSLFNRFRELSPSVYYQVFTKLGNAVITPLAQARNYLKSYMGW